MAVSVFICCSRCFDLFNESRTGEFDEAKSADVKALVDVRPLCGSRHPKSARLRQLDVRALCGRMDGNKVRQSDRMKLQSPHSISKPLWTRRSVHRCGVDRLLERQPEMMRR